MVPAELDDGSIVFSFGEEPEAKAKSAAAPSAVPRKDHDKSTSPIGPQTAQGASQPSQKQSKPAEYGQTDSQSSSKQNLANSSVHNRQQPALTALQRVTTSKAEQVAAPAIDPKIIAKYTRLAVTPNLAFSGSTGRSSSSFDASQSVSSVPSQRPSSPAVVIADLSSSIVNNSTTVGQGPSQKPVSARSAIDPKIIAKYTRRALIPDLSASDSHSSSSSFNAGKLVGSVSSQHPSVPAVAVASASSSSVENSKAVSSAPSQKPVFARSAIDPKIIAKYSRRAVIPDLSASDSHSSSSSSNAGKSVGSVSSQRPSVPAVASASASSSNGDNSETVSQARSQKPVFARSAIDPKIIAKYTRRALIPDLSASGSHSSSSSSSAGKSVGSVSSQRPSVPAVASASASSSNGDNSGTVSQARSQKPVFARSAIDPKIIAKYSRRALIPDLSASGSHSSSSSSNAGKSVGSDSSQRPSVPAVASASAASSSNGDNSETVSQARSQKPAIDPSIIAKYSRRAVTSDLPASASRASSPNLNTGKSASKASTQRAGSPAISLTSPSSSDVGTGDSPTNASTQRPQSPGIPSSDPSSLSADTIKSVSQPPSKRPSPPKPPIDPKIIAKYSRRAVTPDLPASGSQGAEPESRPPSADTSDEGGGSSEAASERLGDMTPEQLQGLKVSACHVACH